MAYKRSRPLSVRTVQIIPRHRPKFLLSFPVRARKIQKTLIIPKKPRRTLFRKAAGTPLEQPNGPARHALPLHPLPTSRPTGIHPARGHPATFRRAPASPGKTVRLPPKSAPPNTRLPTFSWLLTGTQYINAPAQRYLNEISRMNSYLETPRTRLRPFALSDAETAFSWMSDTEVMRFIPLGPDYTIGQTSARISRYIGHQETHGFSKWIILDRESEQPIGDSGFSFLPDGKRVELGYRLRRSHWGQGLATEVATRWIEVASDFLTGETLYAFAHPENAASLHVMTKVGFTYFQNETFYGLDAPLYSLEINNKS